MWPAILLAVRTFVTRAGPVASVIAFPFALVVGIIGYNVERLLTAGDAASGSGGRPATKSVFEERDERVLREATAAAAAGATESWRLEPLSGHNAARPIFDKNDYGLARSDPAAQGQSKYRSGFFADSQQQQQPPASSSGGGPSVAS